MNPFRVTLFAAMVAAPAYFFGDAIGDVAQGAVVQLRLLMRGDTLPVDLKWGTAFAALYAGTMVALWRSVQRAEHDRHTAQSFLAQLYAAKALVLVVAMAIMTPIGFAHGFAQATGAAFLFALALWLALDAILILIGLWKVVVG